MPAARPPAERHAEKINKRGPWSLIKGVPGQCWIWTAGTNRKGYGVIGVNGRSTLAHRLSYELHVGPIPNGLELDHRCRVRGCSNPDHLEPVTHAENVRRGQAGAHWRARTECPQGHPYDAENTRIRPNGGRACRACERLKYHRQAAEQGRAVGLAPAKKTHCKNGHPFNADNTRHRANGNRVCLTCERAAGARYRARATQQTPPTTYPKAA